MKLRQEDRKAVDLLLDRMHTASARGIGSGQAVIYAATDGAIRERVAHVSALLHLLDAMPAAEPPRDLVERTMEQIEKPSTRRHRGLHAPSTSAQHPLA